MKGLRSRVIEICTHFQMKNGTFHAWFLKELMFQASEALHLFGFENFVKSLTSYVGILSSTKFLLSKVNTWQPVCIYYAVTMRNMWFSGSFFSFLKLEAKKAKVTLNWNCIRLRFCDPLNWIVNFEQPEKLAKKLARLRSVYPI